MFESVRGQACLAKLGSAYQAVAKALLAWQQHACLKVERLAVCGLVVLRRTVFCYLHRLELLYLLARSRYGSQGRCGLLQLLLPGLAGVAHAAVPVSVVSPPIASARV